MPGIFHQPHHRRAFIFHSAKLLGAGVLLHQSRGIATGADRLARKEVNLSLLSDTHIHADPQGGKTRNFLPYENLKSIVPQVIGARPDAVVINGDAARLTGELGDYSTLKQLLAPVAEIAPVYIALGNHDNRANFARSFEVPQAARQSVKDKHVLVIQWPALRVVILDSLLNGQVGGLLGKNQRAWLGQYLDNNDGRATMVFLHHTLDDGDAALFDVERLFDLLRSRRMVKAIFYGHSHRYAFAEEHGLKLINLPAVGYNFAATEPVGWVDARFTAEGAELTLRAIAGNRHDDGKTTSLVWR